jgi:hypothetical protein
MMGIIQSLIVGLTVGITLFKVTRAREDKAKNK